MSRFFLRSLLTLSLSGERDGDRLRFFFVIVSSSLFSLTLSLTLSLALSLVVVVVWEGLSDFEADVLVRVSAAAPLLLSLAIKDYDVCDYCASLVYPPSLMVDSWFLDDIALAYSLVLTPLEWCSFEGGTLVTLSRRTTSDCSLLVPISIWEPF